MNIKDISFIIPAFNEEKGLPNCLQFIAAEIARTPGISAEVLVVNNASTDDTKKVALDFSPSVKVVEEPQKGLVFARAAGAKAATGKLLAHVDADCLVPAGWLKKVIEEFSKDPKLVALSGPQHYYDIYNQLSLFKKLVVKTYHLIYYWVYLANRYLWRIGSVIQGGNFIVKASAWAMLEEGNKDINFYGEDTDLCRRLFKLGNVKFDRSLVINASGRRIQGEGMSKTALTYIVNYFSVIFLKKPATKKYTDIRSI